MDRLLIIALFSIALLKMVVVSADVLTMSRHDFDTNYHYTRVKRDVTCGPSDGDISKLKQDTDIHVFANDTNSAILLIWSGTSGSVLALTLDILQLRSSGLYHSTNSGRSFRDISSKINNDRISNSFGVLVSPVDSSFIILVSASTFRFTSLGYESSTQIYITMDSGNSFLSIKCPFLMSLGSLVFSPISSESISVISVEKHALWISQDFGRTWKKVSDSVVQMRWDPTNKNILYFSKDPTNAMSATGFNNELYHVSLSDLANPVKIAEHLYSFGVQGGFLFISIEYLTHNGGRVLHISKDRGKNWNAAQLPVISPKQFYSLLDMTEDMVFVHVDSPDENKFGKIYTSDERGIIYSISLDHHVYDKNGGVTDFYKVESIPGVYIATQADDLGNMRSVITYDKGGTWQSINAPDPKACADKEKKCTLHLHGPINKSKHGQIPEYPKSSASATGIIISHGNIGDTLSLTKPSVFISNDGGYTWRQPAELVGPNFYAIGDSGGILYAVSAYTTTNIIKFSLDEGDCWSEYKFTDKGILVTGISVEPGFRSTLVGLWGWDKEGDQAWRAITVDIAPLLKRTCQNSDYESWMAHESNALYLQQDKCLLGAKVFFTRRKKGHVCQNGKDHKSELVSQECECIKTDFLCDYGYKRDETNQDCILDGSSQTSSKDICIDGTEDVIETKGYRKIPGDKCKGGFDPVTKLISLHKSCYQEKKDDFGVDPNSFTDYTNGKDRKGTSTGTVVFLTVVILGLISVVGVLLYKKQKSQLRVRYSALPTDDEAPVLTPLSNGNSTNENSTYMANGKTEVGGYHDDSDEDMLADA